MDVAAILNLGDESSSDILNLQTNKLSEIPQDNIVQKLNKVQFSYKTDRSVFIAMNCKSLRLRKTAVFYCTVS
jgi:hypothetical protein